MQLSFGMQLNPLFFERPGCGQFLKRWEYDHLTRLLRNLYAGKEATVRTGHGTTEGVRQGCVLSPCLFNLYAEYIMRNARLVKYKLESRLLGEISITSETQMTPPSWQKAKRTKEPLDESERGE